MPIKNRPNPLKANFNAFCFQFFLAIAMIKMRFITMQMKMDVLIAGVRLQKHRFQNL